MSKCAALLSCRVWHGFRKLLVWAKPHPMPVRHPLATRLTSAQPQETTKQLTFPRPRRHPLVSGGSFRTPRRSSGRTAKLYGERQGRADKESMKRERIKHETCTSWNIWNTTSLQETSGQGSRFAKQAAFACISRSTRPSSTILPKDKTFFNFPHQGSSAIVCWYCFGLPRRGEVIIYVFGWCVNILGEK